MGSIDSEMGGVSGAIAIDCEFLTGEDVSPDGVSAHPAHAGPVTSSGHL